MDYTYSRVLNMSFYTQLMETPIFFWCHPYIWSILPYSMIPFGCFQSPQQLLWYHRGFRISVVVCIFHLSCYEEGGSYDWWISVVLLVGLWRTSVLSVLKEDADMLISHYQFIQEGSGFSVRSL